MQKDNSTYAMGSGPTGKGELAFVGLGLLNYFENVVGENHETV
jgi:hypothetical protein